MNDRNSDDRASSAPVETFHSNALGPVTVPEADREDEADPAAAIRRFRIDLRVRYRPTCDSTMRVDAVDETDAIVESVFPHLIREPRVTISGSLSIGSREGETFAIRDGEGEIAYARVLRVGPDEGDGSTVDASSPSKAFYDAKKVLSIARRADEKRATNFFRLGLAAARGIAREIREDGGSASEVLAAIDRAHQDPALR